MTKKEYEERLNDLQNQINELKNVEIEDDAFPQWGDAYWFVNDVGIVASWYWNNEDIDNYRKDFLRIFKTQEECERYLEIQKAFKEESKKFKPDWNDGDKNKYYLCYIHSSNFLMVDSITFTQNDNVNYFEDKKVLYNLVNRFGKEDVKKYYLGIEE